MTNIVNEVLANRETRYGSFDENAGVSVGLKDILRSGRSWDNMRPYQKEALDMIMHKAARIVNGDPDYDDSWIDICGYSQLVVDELHKVWEKQ